MTIPVLKTVGDLSVESHNNVISASTVQTVDLSMKPEIEKNIFFAGFFSALWRRKWLIIFSVALSALLSLWVTLSAQSTYRANATIQIEPQEFVNGSFNGVLNTRSDLFFHTRYKTLTSRKLITKVIEATDLKASLSRVYKPALFDHLMLRIKVLFGFSSQQVLLSPVDFTELFLQRLSVHPVRKTHLVEIYYEGDSPQEAKKVVSSLVEQFILSQTDSETETGRFSEDLLKQQIEEVRKQLRHSEEALVTYSNKKGILSIDENQTRHVTKLNQLNLALVQAEVARSAAESQYQQAQGSGTNVLNNAVIINLKARLLDLEGQYQDKLKVLKPSYPDMLRLKQQIDTVRRKLTLEMAVIKKTRHSDLKVAFLAAKSQERRLRKELSQFNKKLRSLQNSGVDYNRLKRKVESNLHLYKNLLERVGTVSIASSIHSSNIKVVDPAVLPIKAYRPQPVFNFIIGIMSGWLLGLLLVFLREAFDQSLKSTEDLQRITGVPVLGLIPKPKKIAQKTMGMATILFPNAPFSEAYRLLSANVRFGLMRKNGKVLLVTSCLPNEGKTTTVCNMACSYAQMGMKVLLIDADLRKPTIAEKLNILNNLGLSNYLGAQEDLINVTQQVKGVNGLFVIPSGSYSGDTIRMINDDRMQFLLLEAQQKFDFILLDSPTVGAFSDALLLSSLVSSTLIVADEKRLKITKMRQVIVQLMRVKSTVTGVLLVNSTNPLVTDHEYEKHYREDKSSFISTALSNTFMAKLCLNNKTNEVKKIKVKGVKKPFWGKLKKGINLGYMD